MKYVMLETSEGQKLPIIFPTYLNHDLVAQVVMYAVTKQLKAIAKPVSAGFVALGTIQVSGKSESLNLGFNENDCARIMLGDSVSFMPDEMLGPLLGKLNEAVKADETRWPNWGDRPDGFDGPGGAE